ncbi:hypothetical protein D3C80_1814630 [compost metagenome]
MRLRDRLDRPPGFARPQPGHGLHHLTHSRRPFTVRSEIPGLSHRLALFNQRLGQQQVALQRVKYVLPGPHCARVAQGQGLVCIPGTQDVW